MPCLGATLSIREGWLPIVVNAQADALSGKIIGMRQATYPLFFQL